MIKKWKGRLRYISGAAIVYTVLCFLWAGWPLSLWVVLIVGILLARKRQRQPSLSSHGTARWANRKDLARAQLLDAASGLILGRHINDDGGSVGTDNPIVRLRTATHVAVFGPTGSGKGVSLAIPSLLTSRESGVVMDFKAELARETATFREKHFRHRIVLVDPYRKFTSTPDTYNPFDCIHKNDVLAIDDCNDLAADVVARSPNEKDPHWNDSAEAVIAAVAATLVGYDEPGHRSLQTVRQILSHPDKLDLAIKLMVESEHWGGALAQMGGQLLHFADKEKASVLSSALRHLRFVSTPAITQSIATSSFNPADLRRSKMTVYLIVPPDRAQAQSGLLRMWIGSMLRACVREGLQ